MCQGNHGTNQDVNHQLAQEDAQHLSQAGNGRLGTGESNFNMFLAGRSFLQLKATMEAYSRMANRDLLSSVSCEFSEMLKVVWRSSCSVPWNCSAFFVERLYYSIKGTSTGDSTPGQACGHSKWDWSCTNKYMFYQMYQKTQGIMIVKWHEQRFPKASPGICWPIGGIF